MPPNLAHVLAACLVILPLTGCAAASGSPTSPPPAPESAGRQVEEGDVVGALRILRGWDRQRAAAYSTGDVQRLRRLYAPASRAGARDVAVLRRYVDRGLVVEGLTVQVQRARLVTGTPELLRLRVVDRVVGGVAAAPGSGARAALPAGGFSRRVVTLVDRGPRWVVRAVRRG